MMRQAFLCIWVAGALCAQATAGRKLFEAQCALCHGANGGGGRGPSLLQPVLAKAPDDAALEKVISEGLGNEMPGAWQLSPNEVKVLAGYVRSLGRVTPEPVPGDAGRGATVYAARGCAGCHMVDGKGSGSGPELTNIGLRRNAAHLRQSIVEPAAVLPDGFLMVYVQGQGGQRLGGVRVAEDPFTIQVKDLQGRYHSFRKDPLLKVERAAQKQSPMPAYANLPAADLQDLVAYLASLKGASAR